MKTIILGIESSCDETSASICIDGKVMNNIIATQSIHKEYGGVVPELASRAHQKNIVLVVESALKGAQVKFSDLSAISVTQGPGLLGALMVGYSYAKSLAFALNIPIINVNHMKAHILAHFIETPVPIFPFLCHSSFNNSKIDYWKSVYHKRLSKHNFISSSIYNSL